MKFCINLCDKGGCAIYVVVLRENFAQKRNQMTEAMKKSLKKTNYVSNQLLDAVLLDSEEKLIEAMNEVDNVDFEIQITDRLLPDVFAASPPVICIAAAFGAQKCFNKLIILGADLQKTDAKGRSVAHFAALGGSIERIQALLALNVSFDVKDKFEKLPINYAVAFGPVDLMQWMMSQGLCGKSDWESVFRDAVASGRIDMLKSFVALSDKEMITPDLFERNYDYVFTMGNVDVLEYFLEQGCVTTEHHVGLMMAFHRVSPAFFTRVLDVAGDVQKSNGKWITRALQARRPDLALIMVRRGFDLPQARASLERERLIAAFMQKDKARVRMLAEILGVYPAFSVIVKKQDKKRLKEFVMQCGLSERTKNDILKCALVLGDMNIASSAMEMGARLDNGLLDSHTHYKTLLRDQDPVPDELANSLGLLGIFRWNRKNVEEAEFLSLLVSAGMQLNFDDPRYVPPVCIAIGEHNVSLALKLAEFGSRLTKELIDETSLVCHAIKTGSTELLRLVLSSHPTLHLQSDDATVNELLIAASLGLSQSLVAGLVRELLIYAQVNNVHVFVDVVVERLLSIDMSVAELARGRRT